MSAGSASGGTSSVGTGPVGPTSVGPWARYQSELNNPDFVRDPAQEAVVRRLQDLYEHLTDPGRAPSLFGRVLGRQPSAVRGLYLWGGVGRGKTWLVDSFSDCLPADMRLRSHRSAEARLPTGYTPLPPRGGGQSPK